MPGDVCAQGIRQAHSDKEGQKNALEECQEAVKEVVSLISALGSIASSTASGLLATKAVAMSILAFAVSVLDVAFYLSGLPGTAFSFPNRSEAFILFILLSIVMVVAVIIIVYCGVELIKYHFYRRSKNSLIVLEKLLKKRLEILKQCEKVCGELCMDIEAVLSYEGN